MKQKLLSVLFSSLLLTVMVVPTASAAYAGYFWSFDMNHYAVYGDQNGYYYEFDSGDKEVSGQIWADVEGYSDSPLKVRVAAWRDTWGGDTLVGSKYVQPSSTLNDKTSFSLDLGVEPADQYYLRFEKYALTDNGWDLKGEGNFINE